MNQTLNEELTAIFKHHNPNKKISKSITENLAPHIILRSYQVDALERYLFYMEDSNLKPDSPHLLFHMATGSGKTVLMAALILDLFCRGYRNFMFFVNSTQIIEKTKENFLNPASSKFLFAPQITIDRKPVEIRSVETFDAVNLEAINIHFTTIQGLHTKMKKPRENSVTIEDFQDCKLVMISDEAHHLNTVTKNNLTQAETIAKTSWEGTVSEIFEQHSENILLEFTATADLEHEAIRKKYHNKILFDYSLRDFREDKFSKEIVLRYADQSTEMRMKQAMVLSQYRRKVADAHRILCKPVILMKSRTINESVANEKRFKEIVSGLDGNCILELKSESRDDKTLARAFDYFMQERKIGADEFALELKGDFSTEKVVNVNNLKDLEKRQIELNALEEPSNEIRVIFAVDKLNEGWDVLNLFDIVRLYDTRDGKNNKSGKTTMAEAQLIGRGARYFPFIAKERQDVAPEKRKFDHNVWNQLRILEELHYHCRHDPIYIKNITNALKETGLVDENAKRVELKLKKSFKQSKIYKHGCVWVNNRVKNKRMNVNGLKDYNIEIYFTYPHLLTGEVGEVAAFDSLLTPQLNKIESETKQFFVRGFGRNILRFALDSNKFFNYTNLRTYFPNLDGINMFLESDSYLGHVVVDVSGKSKDLDELTSTHKLKIAQFILQQIEDKVKQEAVEYVGTEKFSPCKISNCFIDKTINLMIEGEACRRWTDSEIEGLNRIDLQNENWHAYEDCFGTDQEKMFVKFLHEQKNNIRKKYEEFFLLRNEKAVMIYAFEDGRAFEPDYVLFLRRKGDSDTIVFQVFIEPKNEILMEHDRWKEKFLKQINNKGIIETIIQGTKYSVFGLPFFNDSIHKNAEFKDAFKLLITDC